MLSDGEMFNVYVPVYIVSRPRDITVLLDKKNRPLYFFIVYLFYTIISPAEVIRSSKHVFSDQVAGY